MQRRVLLLLLLAPLLVCLTAPTRAAADDFGETEHRLKTAGIEPDLRKRIHAGIARAVAWLRAKQNPRKGSFSRDIGHTVLAALALRHAATPAALEGSAAALVWLRKYAEGHLQSRTYEGGIAAMLLDANKSDDALGRKIHKQLAIGPGKSGWWGYSPSGTHGRANLSTAQFGALGLWATERRGAPLARAAWLRHLSGTMREQLADGSWTYAPLGGGQQNARYGGYATGTFMGYAGIVLASNALKDDMPEDEDFLARLAIVSARAEGALRRDVQAVLGSPGTALTMSTNLFYRIYALEKACVFAGHTDVGGVDWYREGANILLRGQLRDGGWGVTSLGGATVRRPGTPRVTVRSNTIQTAFGLLFLLRASESYRPLTPRPVDRKPVTTPTGDEPPEPEDLPPPPPRLSIANKILDRLEAHLGAPGVPRLAPYLSAFRFIRRTYPRARTKDGFLSPEHDAWCRRADALLLRAVTHFTAAPGSARGPAVSLEALKTLAVSHPRVGLLLMRRVATMRHDRSFSRHLHSAWYAAAFEALRRLAPAGIDAWLAGRMVTPDLKQAVRSRAALVTLGGRAFFMTGAQRHATARNLLAGLRPLFIRGAITDPGLKRMVRALAFTLQRLATPAAEQGLALNHHAGLATHDAQAIMRWWQAWRAPTASIWQDR